MPGSLNRQLHQIGTSSVAKQVAAQIEGIVMVGRGRKTVKKDAVGSVQLGHRPSL